MAGRKIRFVVGIDGGERELFSVEEGGRGGLTLNLPVDPPPSLLHISKVAHRFSFHESENSADGGFLIKETKKHSDGSIKENYAYVKPLDGHALLPAFSRIPATLRHSPDSTRKPRKATIKVFDKHTGGPIFFVVTVSRAPIERKHFPRGTKTVEKAFKRYHLYVTAGVFYNCGALNRSITATTISSGPRENGIRYKIVPNFKMPEAVSPSPDQLAFFIESRIASVSYFYRKFLSGSPLDTLDATIPDRVARLKRAQLYLPGPDEFDCITSIDDRMRFWRRNPPAGLELHPQHGEFVYHPIDEDELGSK
ncbi:hypothetical protein GGQ97_002286 [Sphingomonas kaistensis]|uniref:Uncharacterized protein n=1 Tax=Sphingomonas kaistensis TaxID=298708 RepID=A0A7X5Y783_9SPHN|nr:hypothetical protein [Sphingomonas kaistensis]NJC06493.1 hypothetical protein [Sphingomonas kaistensis]